jgi:hypothetical protein
MIFARPVDDGFDVAQAIAGPTQPPVTPAAR